MTPVKPVYAFDIDGVLCSTKEVHRAALEAELGGVTLHDGGHYDAFGFHHDSDEILEEVRRIALDLWRRPTVFANGEASGQEVLRELALRNQFAGYITRRHPNLIFDTAVWLNKVGFLPPCYRLMHHPAAQDATSAEALRDGQRQALEKRKSITWSKLKALRQTEILGSGLKADMQRSAVASMIDDLQDQLTALDTTLLIASGFYPLHHMLGDTESKAAPARAMGADTLVEDSPHEALLAARDGLNVVVLRVPYNKDFEQQCKLGRLTNVPPSDPDYLSYFRIRFISTLQELL